MARRAVARDQRTRSCNSSQQKQSDQSIVPRFFKVVFGKDCSKALYIPPQFASKVQHLVNQRIQIKDSCGDEWPAALNECADGSLAFQGGWHKFFLDHDLEEGDFLVFSYMGDHFSVVIFGPSACERINFNNEMPPQNKRSRRDFETDYPSKLFPNTVMNLKDSPPNSDSSVASGMKVWNSQMELVEEKVEFEGLQRPARSIGVEDINCIINRDDGCQGGEMNILYDLSKFEMENMAHRSNKFDEGINSKFACSSSRSADQSKTNGDCTRIPEIHTNPVGGNSGGVFSVNLNKDLNTRLAPSCTKISEQCKTMGNDNQIAVELAHEISGSSGEILISKTLRDLVSKRSGCTEITVNKTEAKVGGRKMTLLNINSPNVNSGHILSDNFRNKQTDYRNLSKDMPDSNFLHGGGKISGKESTAQHWVFNSSISSTLPKNPIETGTWSIKEELVEKLEGAGSLLLSCGKEPNTCGTQDQMFSPVIKTEPDLPFDICSSSFSPFTVEVKKLSYQEVPAPLPSFPRRKEKGRGRIIYLKDSLGRTWPVLQPDTHPVLALTSNWKKFCGFNNIRIGNKCTFQADEDMLYGCRVEVDRSM